MEECGAWLTLLLLTEWVLGNLYEAVTFIPNAISLIELKSRAGEAVFKTKARSPIVYYVPASSLALVLMSVSAVDGVFRRKPETPYVLAALSLSFVAGGLTLYVVRHINLDLFFKPQTDFARARRLLDTWATLNYLRLTIGSASLFFVILWIRTIIKS
jgi:hypothetical protein